MVKDTSILLKAILATFLILNFCFSPKSISQALDEDPIPLDSAQVQIIKNVLSAPEEYLDYLEVKLIIDNQIAPFRFSPNNIRSRINQMVNDITQMLPPAPKETDKLVIIQKYLYKPGKWNDFQPFQYDFDDPLGTENPKAPLLYNYLKTKKGNCVSMPILHLILADRLGLNVTLTNAPKHILMHYQQPSTKKNILIESTSGGHSARASWISEQYDISPTAIQNGIYLKKLNKRQSIALMTFSVTSHFYTQRHYYTAIALSELQLKLNPRAIDAILTRGASYGWIAEMLYQNRYANFLQIPKHKQAHADFVTRTKVETYNLAKKLGWQEDTPEKRENYLKNIGRVSSAQN